MHLKKKLLGAVSANCAALIHDTIVGILEIPARRLQASTSVLSVTKIGTPTGIHQRRSQQPGYVADISLLVLQVTGDLPLCEICPLFFCFLFDASSTSKSAPRAAPQG